MSDLPNVPFDEGKAVCKIGQRAACCRYLIVSSDGFGCAKNVPDLRTLLDVRVVQESITARGDNCPGKPYPS